MKPALLIIDVQQGLCIGADAAWNAAQVVARIDALARRARRVGVPVVFVQHESRAGFLEHGSPGWQLADGLQPFDVDHRIRKTTPDAFHETTLAATLRALHATSVIVCGMHSEFCIDTTTRKALLLGYPVTLVSDGHTTSDKPHLSAAHIIEHHNETLANIASFGPRVALERADGLLVEADDAVRAS